MSRILVVNQYFPPDQSATAAIANDVVQALGAAGHDVTVLAGRPSYGVQGSSVWGWRSVHPAKQLRVIRVASAAFSRDHMAGRITNYLSYMLFAFCEALCIRTDLVLTMTDPPLTVVLGAVLAGILRVPFIYNPRDIHPDMAVASGMAPAGVATQFWDWMHRRAARRAALVIALGEDMRTRLMAKGISPQRIVVIRDGARAVEPPSDSSSPQSTSVLSASAKRSSPFVLMHAGNIGFAGAWESLFAAVSELAVEGVSLIVVGDGALRSTVVDMAAHLSNVRFVPAVPKPQFTALLNQADLHLVTLREGLEGLVVPSKLYPLLFAGCPILAIVPESSDVARIVRNFCCGWVASPSNPSDITAAVRDAIQNPAELSARGKRARKAAPSFDRDALLMHYVRAVETVLAATNRPP